MDISPEKLPRFEVASVKFRSLTVLFDECAPTRI
jgi:hypothetical protein